ncbi:MAG: quinone-dependent dihydroorotate dehydrogenase [Homoserinimonas sp.]|nr:quinone-dependent dihydroorotate dehydrogenase [Homoserinimonas sp.]MCW5944173.1 quinone-dependent dihydroorotate dehydrogenase [Cryobacterium sp.]
MYKFIFKTFLTRLDAEFAHGLAFLLIRILGLPGIRSAVHSFTRPKANGPVELMGLKFSSRFGLAAGFDKDAKGLRGLWALGFGHVEVGTVTALAQPGNPRPRLFRLVADRALINRMGFNNHGAEAAARAIARFRELRKDLVVGANIGKSRATPVEEAVADYEQSATLLAPVADYLVVNVSSPNTPGLRGLQEASKLRPLLSAILAVAGECPVLVKLAPDLENDELAGIAKLVTELGLAGVIATNTTISRSGLRSEEELILKAGEGGLSGAPLAPRSVEVLRLLRKALGSDCCIISVGGVESAADVTARLEAGADLVQGYTGFIYRGPLWARQLNRAVRA